MKRAVRMLFRLIACGIVVFGGMELILELARHRLNGAEISLWHCGLGAVLIVLGAALFAFSPKLAEQLAGDFDE